MRAIHERRRKGGHAPEYLRTGNEAAPGEGEREPGTADGHGRRIDAGERGRRIEHREGLRGREPAAGRRVADQDVEDARLRNVGIGQRDGQRVAVDEL